MYRKTLAASLMAVICLVPLANALAQTSLPPLNVLDRAGWQSIASQRNVADGFQFSLLAFREVPALLDEKPMMQCFISINNTPTQTANAISRATRNNELLYPEVADFYKPKAAAILKELPLNTYSKIVDQAMIPTSVRPNPMSSMMFGERMGMYQIMLGEYDVARKAFPFVDFQGNKLTLSFDIVETNDNGNCGNLRFFVKFPQVSFSEVPMDEAAARVFLSTAGRAGPGGVLNLKFDMDILDTVPELRPPSFEDQSRRRYVFSGKINKITVLKDVIHGNSVVSTLYP